MTLLEVLETVQKAYPCQDGIAAGDSLYRFIIDELESTWDGTVQESVRALNQAIADIEEVRSALQMCIEGKAIPGFQQTVIDAFDVRLILDGLQPITQDDERTPQERERAKRFIAAAFQQNVIGATITWIPKPE